LGRGSSARLKAIEISAEMGMTGGEVKLDQDAGSSREQKEKKEGQPFSQGGWPYFFDAT
jgi:hypothetical protein